MPPRRLREGGLADVRGAACGAASTTPRTSRAEVGAHLVMIGILPTLADGHLSRDSAQRQPALRAAQRADLRRPRRGHRDRHRRASSGCATTADSIVPEAACTSMQLHLQVSPGRSSRRTGTPPRRSPACSSRSAPTRRTCFGKELWRETRIPLFEQATDTRSEELKAQGVRPRVWFGERWITSIFDLFEENVRYFPALLPITEDEDPLEVLEARRRARSWPSCGCTTARSTAGTGRSTTSSAGVPHLRVENRVLPAGPTVVDIDGQRRLLLRAGPRAGRERAAAVVADVVQRRRGELPRRPPSTASTPRSTGRASARCRPPSWCCAGCCRWPTRGSTRWGVDAGGPRPAARHHRAALPDRHQRRGVVRRADGTQRARPWTATTRCARRCCEYRERMHTNEPVHTWD